MEVRLLLTSSSSRILMIKNKCENNDTTRSSMMMMMMTKNKKRHSSPLLSSSFSTTYNKSYSSPVVLLSSRWMRRPPPPPCGGGGIRRSNNSTARYYGWWTRTRTRTRAASSLFVTIASAAAQSTTTITTVLGLISFVAVSVLLFFHSSSKPPPPPPNGHPKPHTKESGPSSPVKSEQIEVITNQLDKNQTSTLDTVSSEVSTQPIKQVLESKYGNKIELQVKVDPSLPTIPLIANRDESPDTSTSPSLSVISNSASSQLEDDVEWLDLDSGVTSNEQGEVDEHKMLASKVADVAQTTSYSGVFRDSSREALHTFCVTSLKSRKNLNSRRASPSYVSLRNPTGISSQGGISTDNGINAVMKTSVDVADPETVKRTAPLPYFKEGSIYKSKDFGASKGYPGKKRRFSTQDSGGESKILSSSNLLHVSGTLSSEKRLPSEDMSPYDKLVRAGRLTDCLELLKDMERKGLLDMDKVYHSRFYKTCQSQKAVQEAFRFTKLIPNPKPSTFNMLMSVCASSQDSEGAFEVLQLAQEAGIKADCKLYTTLISTCAKCGKVDLMFKVFHEMVSAGVEPNVHTYGTLIDGCAKAGQIAKAFGAYGIMRSKNVKPDRVIFNALITACGQSGAVDRAFDVLSEMTSEAQPIEPDHITIGALMKACANSGQVQQAREVYDMIRKHNLKGSPEVYTIAVNSCSETGDWEFACNVYNDMIRNGIIPDEVFLSAMVDAAGHAGKVDAAFGILQEAKNRGMHLGVISYSSLMGACCNAKYWEKALELYEDIKAIKLKPTVSTMNALITSLCDGNQLEKAMEILSEMKRIGLCPNTITYSILVVASEKKDDVDAGLMLLSEAKKDGVSLNLVMCRCILAMCLRRFEKACALGEPVLSFNGRSPQIDCKWTSLALTVYRETIVAGVVPTMEVVSLILGCLRLPHDTSLREKVIENLDVNTYSRKKSNLCSLVAGFGEYDPRAISLFEEAASFEIVPCVSFKDSLIVVDVRELPILTAEVYLLTVLKGLKYRRAAGAKLPNTIILLPVEKTNVPSSKGEKIVNIAGRISQAVASVLRRLGLRYQGNESYGKIRIQGFAVKKWLQPKLSSPFSGKQTESNSSLSRLGLGISHQQRRIRTGNLLLFLTVWIDHFVLTYHANVLM